MSAAWFFPSWNGDVRIEEDPVDPKVTIITVIEPTVEELRVLSACAELFKAKGWMGRWKTIWNPRGNRDLQKTRIHAPLVEIGLYMIAHLKPGVTSLTAVKMSDGTVTAKGSAERGFLNWLNSLFSRADGNRNLGSTKQLAGLLESAAKMDSAAAEAAAQELWEKAEAKRAKDREAEIQVEEEERAKEPPPHRREAKLEEEKPEPKPEKKPEKAATTRRPTSCCPRCTEGSVEPATEVLLNFLDDEQHEMWAEERAFIAHGHLTGHRYLVAHRHSRHAQRAGKICFDLDDAAVLHFHNSAYPPEEEALSAKLCIEHRENWIRHEATCLGGDFDWVFKNPFGGGGDGVPDSQFAGEIGSAIRGFLMTFEGGKYALPQDRHLVGKVNVDVGRMLGRLSRSTSYYSYS